MFQNSKVVFGPPGTGKTAYLIDRAKASVEQHGQDRVAFVSFTRQGADEATARIGPGDYPYFRTIHSLCYHLLGMQRGDVMDDRDWRILGKELNMDFYGVDTEGSRCLMIKALAMANDISAQEQWSKMAFPGVTIYQLNLFTRVLSEYKANHFVKDFDDMLLAARKKNLRCPVRVAFIDEAQDLTRLQWMVVATLFREAGRVEIAGDDDQAIFEWTGADVRTLIDMPGEREVLQHSFRVPEKVRSVALEAVKHIRFRQGKDWSARPAPGLVKDINSLANLPVEHGEWLLLARNNYQTRDIKRHLYTSGIGFSDAVPAKYLRAIELWAKEEFTQAEALEFFELCLLANAQYSKAQLHLLKTRQHWTRGELPYKGGRLNVPEKWQRFCERAEKPNDPRIRVMTVHRAKGAEADCVLYMGSLTRRQHDAHLSYTDAEWRVTYTAYTRARCALYRFSGAGTVY